MHDNLIIYRPGMDYGVGVDSASGDSRSVGVLGEQSSIPNATGSIVSFSLTQVTCDDDLQKALGVSVDTVLAGRLHQLALLRLLGARASSLRAAVVRGTAVTGEMQSVSNTADSSRLGSTNQVFP